MSYRIEIKLPKIFQNIEAHRLIDDPDDWLSAGPYSEAQARDEAKKIEAQYGRRNVRIVRVEEDLLHTVRRDGRNWE